MPLVEFDTKVYPIGSPVCFAGTKSDNSNICDNTVSKDFLNKRFYPDVFSKIQSRAQIHTHFSVFNGFDLFCKGDACYRSVDGGFAYADTNHLTDHGALLMHERFNAFLFSNRIFQF